MTHPLDLRRKAREYRRERNLTIDEIAERLAVSRTTVYYWVKDMPPRKRERTRGQQMAADANRARCKALRKRYSNSRRLISPVRASCVA